MTAVTFDFAILGDQQPEGLWVGSALVRKGYSVALVPSSSFGELPPDDFMPLTFPVQMGTRRLDDLLFRAGFFRLEDSGLVSSFYQNQLVMPRHRTITLGGIDQWMHEVKREFPLISEPFQNIINELKQSQRSDSAVRRAATEVLALMKRDVSFGRWFELELDVLLKPHPDERGVRDSELKALIEEWFRFMLQWGGKWYRVDPRLKTSYNQFLQDHARKWGVQIVSSSIDIKGHWSSFQLSKDQKARYLIANGLGALRQVSKTMENPIADRFSYWLFVDRIECSLSQLPEPLQEFCVFDMGKTVEGSPAHHFLHTKKDVLRDEAVLSLGTWLAFEEPRTWNVAIERGRESLRQILPFLPESCFRAIPSLFDLTEMRGECVRRGQVDRLIPFTREKIGWEKFRSQFTQLFRSARAPQEVSHRIFSLIPGASESRNRMRRFGEALNILDHFEKKRRIA